MGVVFPSILFDSLSGVVFNAPFYSERGRRVFAVVEHGNGFMEHSRVRGVVVHFYFRCFAGLHRFVWPLGHRASARGFYTDLYLKLLNKFTFPIFGTGCSLLMFKYLSALYHYNWCANKHIKGYNTLDYQQCVPGICKKKRTFSVAVECKFAKIYFYGFKLNFCVVAGCCCSTGKTSKGQINK